MSRSTHIAWIALFGAPFALLTVCYGALPSDLPVLRIPFGHVVTVASKSLFAVYRVPFMNLMHGLMAVVMLSRSSDFEDAKPRAAYENAFTTLLFAIALKSDFEAIQFSLLTDPTLPAAYVSWAAAGTGLSVILGLGFAFACSLRAPIPWRDLRLPIRDKIALAAFFIAYLGIVIASTRISHRA